jgi:hypothetical protein
MSTDKDTGAGAQAPRIRLTPRQLATIHKHAGLDGRDGREFAMIELEQDGEAVIVAQGVSRWRCEPGTTLPDRLEDAERSTS